MSHHKYHANQDIFADQTYPNMMTQEVHSKALDVKAMQGKYEL
jgi:hypothetical protein